MPVILPKIKPLKLPKPEVLGSISMTKTKNQLISKREFPPWIENSPIKKIRKPKTCGSFLIA